MAAERHIVGVACGQALKLKRLSQTILRRPSVFRLALKNKAGS